MYTHAVLFAATVLCCAQCSPVDTTTTTASSTSSQLHLLVDNSTKSTNYHLTPVLDELENIDEEVENDLHAILPYINFFLDALFGRSSAEDSPEDDCIDDMVVQLVPDESRVTSSGKPKPELVSGTTSDDKSEPNPDEAADDLEEPNAEEEGKGISESKAEPKPDVPSIPEAPSTPVEV